LFFLNMCLLIWCGDTAEIVWSLTALWFWYYSAHYVLDFCVESLLFSLHEFFFYKSAKKKFQASAHSFPFLFCIFRSVLSLYEKLRRDFFNPLHFFPTVQIFSSFFRCSIACSPLHGWFWIFLARHCLLFGPWLIRQHVNSGGDLRAMGDGGRRPAQRESTAGSHGGSMTWSARCCRRRGRPWRPGSSCVRKSRSGWLARCSRAPLFSGNMSRFSLHFLSCIFKSWSSIVDTR
jgi:hypothetical protein